MGGNQGGAVAQAGSHPPSAAAPARPGQRSPARLTAQAAGGAVHCGVRVAAWAAAESELRPGRPDWPVPPSGGWRWRQRPRAPRPQARLGRRVR